MELTTYYFYFVMMVDGGNLKSVLFLDPLPVLLADPLPVLLLDPPAPLIPPLIPPLADSLVPFETPAVLFITVVSEVIEF